MIKNKICIIAIFLCLTQLNCLSNGGCYRDLKGKVLSNNYSEEYKVVLTRSEQGYPDITDSPQVNNKYFISKDQESGGQGPCRNNDCGQWKMPDSVSLKVYDQSKKSVLVDTVFKCEQFRFDNDDIVLPDIVIDSVQ